MPAKTRISELAWSQDENEILKSCSVSNLTVPDVKRKYLPHRTEAAIAKQGYAIGVTFARRPGPSRKRTEGTPEKARYQATGVLKHCNGLDVHY